MIISFSRIRQIEDSRSCRFMVAVDTILHGVIIENEEDVENSENGLFLAKVQ